MKKYILYIIIIISSIVLFIIIGIPILKTFSINNLKNIVKVLTDKQVINSILLTFSSSLFSTFIGLIFGVPFAYFLSKNTFIGKQIIEAIIDIPVLIPHAAAGIALLSVFGSKMFLGRMFSFFGIEIVGSQVGIVLGMTFVSIPFLINHAKEGFKKINPNLIIASQTLGASDLYTFMNVSIPLAKKDIITGIIMAWARGISEYATIIVLVYNPKIISTLILERFESYGLSEASPIVSLLIILGIILFITLRLFGKNKK